MQTYKNYTIHPCYQEKYMSNYFIINSHKSHRSCIFRVKISFSMFSNTGYHVLKFVGKNSDVYGLIVEESLLVLPLKAFIKRKISLLATLYHTYMRKTG